MVLVQRLKKHEDTQIKQVCKVSMIIFGALLAFGLIFLLLYTIQIQSKVENYDDSVVFNLSQNSRIYAADGETVLAELQIENREPVASLSDITTNVINASIATEDARFYQHKGVDLFALFRAAGVIFSGGSTQGGSTITMQLVRNTILSKEAQTITLERKISEMILANRIEEMYDKDTILLMYLNTINYGDRCYGIKAASKHYFSVLPDQLNLVQAATLVGIPQSPAYLSPSTNPDACLNRRNTVLRRMFDEHMISQEEFNAACLSPIELNIS